MASTMSKKQPSEKSKVWERARRYRLNACFTKLSLLLPQDVTEGEKSSLSKICILQKAAAFIKEVLIRNKKATCTGNEGPFVDLRLRLDAMIARCKQLTKLLQDAGIIIPPIKCKGIVVDCKAGSEKIIKKQDGKNISNESPTQIHHVKNIDNSKPNASSIKQGLCNKPAENKYTVISQTEANARLPIPSTMSTTKAYPSSIMSICPTFIISNGSLVPIMQQTPVVAAQQLIIVQKPQSDHVLKSSAYKNNNIQQQGKQHGLQKITSKRFQVDVTQTTMVNKVPIPALTCRYEAKPQDFVIPEVPRQLKTNEQRCKVKDKCKNKITYRMLRKGNLRMRTPKTKLVQRNIPSRDNAFHDVNKENDKVDNSNSNKPNHNDKLSLKENKNEACQNKDTNHKPGIKRLHEDTCSLKQLNQTENKKIKLDNEDNSKGSGYTYSIDSLCQDNNTKREFKDRMHAKLPNNILGLNNITPPKDLLQDSVDNLCTKESLNKVFNTNGDNTKPCDNMSLTLPHSDLSNDIFASLQVPSGSHHPESTSPTAAFLLAFPLVSSLGGGKVPEALAEESSSTSQHGTGTLIQLGALDNKADTNLPSNALTMENFSTFFTSKDIYSNICTSFDSVVKDPTKEKANKYMDIPTNKMDAFKDSDDRILQTNHDNNLFLKNESILKNSTCLFADMPLFQNNKYNENNIGNNMNCSMSGSGNQYVFNYEHAPVLQNIKQEKNKFSHTNKFNPVENILNNQNMNNKLQASQSLNKSSINIEYTTVSTMTTPKYSYSSCNTFNPFCTDFNPQYDHGLYFPSIGKEIPVTSSSVNYQHLYTPSSDTPAQKSTNTYNAYDGYKYIKPNKHKPDQHSKSGTTQLKTSIPQINNISTTRPPVNWMTAPDIRPHNNSEFLLPPWERKLEFQNDTASGGNNFTSTNQPFYSSYSTDSSIKPLDNQTNKKPEPYYATPAVSFQSEDNHFAWSPTKLPSLLETSHSVTVPSTLPTLIGDLALGTPSTPFLQNQHENTTKTYTSFNDHKKSNMPDAKAKLVEKGVGTFYQNFSNMSSQNSTSHFSNNFLSVSQLVDAKTRNMNTSVNTSVNTINMQKMPKRAKCNEHVEEKKNNKEYCVKNIFMTPETTGLPNEKFTNYNNLNEPTYQKTMPKNSSTYKNYSAESLIGNVAPNNDFSKGRFQQFPTFGSDTIVPPFFPPMTLQDTPQMQLQNNFSTSTSLQNANYTPSYNVPLPNYPGLLSDVNNDYNYLHSEIQYSKNGMPKKQHTYANKNIDQRKVFQSNTCSGSKKKKGRNHDSVNFPDLGFLSAPMDGASPVVDELFPHGSVFSNSGQLYSQGGLYPAVTAGKVFSQGQSLLPPVTSSSTGPAKVATTSTGGANPTTTLANFNLCTIFPEINSKVRCVW